MKFRMKLNADIGKTPRALLFRLEQKWIWDTTQWPLVLCISIGSTCFTHLGKFALS